VFRLLTIVAILMARVFGCKRMDLRKIGWEVVKLMHLAQDRDQRWALLNIVMNLRVP
jgi:hypothetical protein